MTEIKLTSQVISQGISPQTYVQPLALAVIHIGLGDHDEAFDWLGKAFADRSAGLVYLKVDPVFDTISTDARFTDLERRVGLPSARQVGLRRACAKILETQLRADAVRL